MRTLDRNKRNICYALCRGKVRETDRNGDFTGDDVIIYTRPVLERLNYSETRGRATLEGFGITEPYTVTVVTDDMYCPLDVDSVVWLDIAPTEFDENHIYMVGEYVVYGNSIYKCKKPGGSKENLVPIQTAEGANIEDENGNIIVALIGRIFDEDAWDEVERDYVVVQKSPTLNSISYVLRKVK